MLRRPPRSTRTATLFPYTTLFPAQDQALGLRKIAQARTAVEHRLLDVEQAAFLLPLELEAVLRIGKVCIRSLQRDPRQPVGERLRSEEHTSELQSLMRISYAVFCLTK